MKYYDNINDIKVGDVLKNIITNDVYVILKVDSCEDRYYEDRYYTQLYYITDMEYEMMKNRKTIDLLDIDYDIICGDEMVVSDYKLIDHYNINYKQIITFNEVN